MLLLIHMSVFEASAVAAGSFRLGFRLLQSLGLLCKCVKTCSAAPAGQVPRILKNL